MHDIQQIHFKEETGGVDEEDQRQCSFLQDEFTRKVYQEEIMNENGFKVVLSAHFSALVYGSPKGYFCSSRGLHQGDPLSPMNLCYLLEWWNRGSLACHD